ncbi:MAG: T9SS type A sorting domain-containing protein [Bacteroidetes bacterium]|nr:T9SS type A sorting domain-containing protein [Bacteroidota bacterium]
MRIFTILLLTVIVLSISGISFSQNKNIYSALRDPNPGKQINIEPSASVQSYMSRWFGDALNGSTGVVKSFLNTPGSLTMLFSSSRSLFGAARSTSGIYYALEYTAPGAGNLVTIDTASGNISTIAPLSGLGTGHIVTGMAWDKNTSVMYVVSTDGASGRLYTVNLATGALTTQAASMTGSTFPIDIAINNSGAMYSCDVTTSSLNLINKTTGAATLIGALGITINYAQGMAFDPETDSLFLAAYTDAGKLYRCNTSNGSVTLIGNFGSSGNEIDAFIIPPAVNRQLNAFNLQSPLSDVRIVTVAGSSTPVTISWDTSGAGASYKFIFGNPAVPPRRIIISSTTNSISTTLGALDNILASNGFTNNGSATDSAAGQWDVWAYKGAGAPGTDSIKATNGPRTITLRRQQASLSPFALVSPVSPLTILTSPVDTSLITFSWRKSGPGVTYKWLFKNSGTYSEPPTIKLTSDNSGLDTNCSIRVSRLDSILSGLGIAAGDSSTGVWRARAYALGDSLNSTAPDRQITFKRTGLLQLNQPFAETNFPPLYWSLEYAGALYWSRETPSAFGTGAGSARFKFWSADFGTTQSLISNQFPPIGAGPYYIKFDYAYRFYVDGGGILANDSVGVFTSTDNGASWISLKTLFATQTPQVGINSSNNLTTASGSGEYTAPSNGEWATKILPLPLGTNKVKFTAYSSYGNNVFIDNIQSFLFVGVTPVAGSIPNEYKLSQNYPNPFNPVTKISFSIPKQSFVTLKIFDVVGREVSILVNSQLEPDRYEFSFDASKLSSGVYFYQLETIDFRDIKRMVLIK